MTARDLAVAFTPTPDEVLLARRSAKGPVAQLGFLVLLKLFQRLGRPVPLAEAPRSAIEHVARAAGMPGASLAVDPGHRKGGAEIGVGTAAGQLVLAELHVVRGCRLEDQGYRPAVPTPTAACPPSRFGPMHALRDSPSPGDPLARF